MNALTLKSKDEINVLLNELIERVRPVFGASLKKVMLFGSYARGDYDEESDIDVLIMVDEDEKSLEQHDKEILTINKEGICLYESKQN
jgi:predicted nucleotidyltransferase